MHKSLHYLRIAWSVVCVIACVLLIALWVRSFLHRDTFGKVDSSGVSVCSISRGSLQLGRLSGSVIGGVERWGTRWQWTKDSEDFGPQFDGDAAIQPKSRWVFISLWLPILVLAAITSLPWIRWRFTLRTLLMVTTLPAAVLGLIVYASRTQ